MARPQPRLTYEEYQTFPDTERWELIDGEAFLAPSPSVRHQDIVLRLGRWIADHLDRHGGGKVVMDLDTVITESDVVRPDVLFIADDDLAKLTDQEVRGAPTWVIEVLSHHRDRTLKHQLYARGGVPEYWIVDPEADRVEVHRLEGGSYPDPEALEPGATARPLRPAGLEIDVAALLRR